MDIARIAPTLALATAFLVLAVLIASLCLLSDHRERWANTRAARLTDHTHEGGHSRGAMRSPSHKA
ncbi:hypothetical protein [Streptomyces sp. NPDC000229]|uniref:hypothetical protein n=1 Tax=Streptomyces sp. NPDC000229 TaxID=3154247 RepID=UPI00331C631D